MESSLLAQRILEAEGVSRDKIEDLLTVTSREGTEPHHVKQFPKKNRN